MGIQAKGTQLFSNNLSEQFKLSIQNTFDKLSEKYPIKKISNGITFWDYIAEKVVIEFSGKDISEDNINRVIRSILNELVIDVKEKQELEDIYNYFWYLLKNEIIMHTELYNYMTLSYNQDIKNEIFGIKEKIKGLLSVTQLNKNEVDIKTYRNELVNYIISIQQIYVNEIGNDFIDRKFLDQDKYPQAHLDNLDIIKHNKNVLILGEPGYGKTYSIKKILYEITLIEDVNFAYKIPVYLNLSVYGYKYDTILDGILDLLSKYITEITKEDINKLLQQGHFIILLDGLDEVKQQYYEKCISDLRDMMKYNLLSKYIIAGRENIYFDELNYLVEIVNLFPLNKVQIADHIEKYCNISSRQIAQEQYDLFQNPLLLNIGIEIINSNNGKIPDNRSVMFNKYIEYLSYKWERKKGLRRSYELSYYEVISLLSKVAFSMFEDPFLTTLGLQELIKKEFSNKDLSSIFDQIINMGVFKYRFNDEIWFVHKTFKEYFAGRFIVNHIEESKSLDIAHSIIDKKQWYEVFVFASGLFHNWKLQNDFFDYVLENNISLYIGCVKGKNDFNEYLLSLDIQRCSETYLDILITSYEKIIEKYFSQIKSQFNPFYGRAEINKDSKIGILGQLSEDRKYIYYTLVVRNQGEERISCVSPKKFEEYHKTINSTRFQSNFVNLELSNMMGDSARAVALKEIKSNLSSILKEQRLVESKFLVCERVEEMKRRLPIKDIEDLKDIYDWIQNKIEKAQNKVEGTLVGYSYEGVELLDLQYFVGGLLQNNVNYQECLLPKKDKSENCRWAWDFYSKDRLIERVRKFFHYYQISFIDLIEKNFAELKKHLPDYSNLPYKFIVEIEFMEQSVKDYYSEPSICYYYCATDSFEDNMTEIKIVDKKIDWNEHEKLIQQSFKDKGRFNNVYSVTNTGVTMTMYERRTRRELPLSSNTYELIKKNLEYIFGKL